MWIDPPHRFAGGGEGACGPARHSQEMCECRSLVGEGASIANAFGIRVLYAKNGQHFVLAYGDSEGEPGEGSVPKYDSDPSPALARLRLREGTLSHKGTNSARANASSAAPSQLMGSTEIADSPSSARIAPITPGATSPGWVNST